MERSNIWFVGLVFSLSVLCLAQSEKLQPETAERTLASVGVPEKVSEQSWIRIIGEKKDQPYSLRGGDNLWELSDKFFQNPRLWPKVWATNPSIENPHDVEVGRQLEFYRRLSDPQRNIARIPLVTLVPGQEGAVTDLDKGSFVKVDLKNRYRPNIFLLTEKDEVFGSVRGAFIQRAWFWDYDDIELDMLDAAQVKVGDRFSIVRKEREIEDHTRDGSPEIGTLVRLLGMAEITLVKDGSVMARLISVYGPMKRGDIVIAAKKPVEWLSEVTPPSGLQLEILLGGDPETDFLSQGQVVILNKGLSDGVQMGHLYRVIEEFDRLDEDIRLYATSKGEIQIIHSTESSSVGFILKSSHPIAPGDVLLPYQEVISTAKQYEYNPEIVEIE